MLSRFRLNFAGEREEIPQPMLDSITPKEEPGTVGIKEEEDGNQEA